MLSTEMSPWPCFSGEEVNATATLIASNHITYRTGNECRGFDQGFAALTHIGQTICEDGL